MFLHAQNSTLKRFNYGLTLQPEFTTSRSILPHTSVDITNTPKLGVGLGFDLQMKLNDLFSLRTGMGFSMKRLTHTWNKLTLGSPEFSEAVLQTNVSFIDIYIPLHLLIQLKKGFYISLGGELSSVLSNSSERKLIYADGFEEKLSTRAFPFVNYSGQIGVGYKMSVHSKTIQIEPFFKHYFSDGAIQDNLLMNVGTRCVWFF